MGRLWSTSLLRLRWRTNDWRPLERVLGRLEHLGVGVEDRPGPAAAALRPDLRDRHARLAALVLLGPDVAIPGRLDAEEVGQGVDDAHSDAVEPARDLVAAAAELAAGMEDGVDDLEGVLPGGVLADRHAAAVVDHLERVVWLDRDPDRRGVAGHRLVERVVDDLPDEVVEAADVGRADVHPGPSPDRLQALEDLDARRGVVARDAGLATVRRAARARHGFAGPGGLGHAVPPIKRSYRRPSSSSL
jgi:hypothetical protein